MNGTRERRPVLIAALAVALVITNLLWAYNWLDRGVTLSHHSEEVARQKEIVSALSSFLVDLPREAGIERTAGFVREKYPDMVVKIDGNRLEAGAVILEFAGNRVARVTTM